MRHVLGRCKLFALGGTASIVMSLGVLPAHLHLDSQGVSSSRTIVVTLADEGHHYFIHKGDSLVVELSGLSDFTWSEPSSSNPAVLELLSGTSGATATGDFLAVENGKASVSAEGIPNCSAVCAQPIVLFQVKVTVHKRVPIGADQHFEGLVNRDSGASAPAVIKVACPVAVQPDETGHPMAGQTITVKHAAGTGGNFGTTGPTTTSIGAFFGVLPPAATGSSTSNVTFTTYGTVAMPTSLVLPCSGTGTVNFIPIPVSPSTPASVPVIYVAQP